MPYADPEKQKTAMREIMQERRNIEREAKKTVTEIVNPLIKELTGKNPVEKEPFKALEQWLLPEFCQALREMAVKTNDSNEDYMRFDNMLANIQNGITPESLAVAISYRHGEYLLIGQLIYDLRAVYNSSGEYELATNRHFMIESLKALLEAYKSGSCKNPEDKPFLLFVSYIATVEAKKQEYFKTLKASDKHE